MAPYLVPKDRILKMFMFAGAVGSFISNITAPLLNWLKVNMKNIKGVKKKSVLFVFCSNNAYFLVNIIFNIFIEYILHV